MRAWHIVRSRLRSIQALRLFGGVEEIKEASRDARGTAAFDALARDLRYGVRHRRQHRDRGDRARGRLRDGATGP